MGQKQRKGEKEEREKVGDTGRERKGKKGWEKRGDSNREKEGKRREKM